MTDFAEFTLPPRLEAGICPVCRSINYTQQTLCLECTSIGNELGGQLLPTSPMTMYAKPSAMRDWLTFYKDSPGVSASAQARERLAGLLSRYLPALVDHNRGQVDVISVVPSTERPAPHPLEEILASVKLPVPLVPGPTRTSAPIGHNRPNRDAYAADTKWAGVRVLLVDDVYTTGARAQSVRCVLTDSGADVVGLAVMSRRINPDYHERAAALWAQLHAAAFTIEESVHRSIRWTS